MSLERLHNHLIRTNLEEHRLELTGLCFICADKASVQPKAAIGSHLRRYPGQ